MSSRRANAVLFGFDFQVNAAIMLMLENMADLESLRLESNYEDIDLTLADRMIVNRDGTVPWIQTKYYQTANGSVSAAFDDAGNYRYVMDGKAMQLEVPADQYDEAVEIMRKKIANGQLANCGITDPDEAGNIIRKGRLTFEQAKNIAKAGNIDSLKYDAAHGFVSASCAAGITFEKMDPT